MCLHITPGTQNKLWKSGGTPSPKGNHPRDFTFKKNPSPGPPQTFQDRLSTPFKPCFFDRNLDRNCQSFEYLNFSHSWRKWRTLRAENPTSDGSGERCNVSDQKIHLLKIREKWRNFYSSFLTTCLADKSPVKRLILNRSQCGSCSTKYDTSAST